MAIVNMKYMPTPTVEHVVNLDRLDGGLNIDELPFRLKNNESPAMKNLFWRDGILCARDGQEWTIPSEEDASEILVLNYSVSGDEVDGPEPDPETVSNTAPNTPTALPNDTSTIKAGTTVKFSCKKDPPHETEEDTNAVILYSTNGGASWHTGKEYKVWKDCTLWVKAVYYRMRGMRMYERLFHGFVVAARYDHVYQTHLCWADPNAVTPTWTDLATAENGWDGSFFIYGEYLYYKGDGCYFRVKAVTEGGVEHLEAEAIAEPGAATYIAYTPVIIINASPSNGSGDIYQPENRISPYKTVWYTIPNDDPATYKLPVKDIDSVEEVIVRGETQTVTTHYTVDLTNGTVTFTAGHVPQHTTPPANNEVVITYGKANTDAYNSVMSCKYAATYGGTGDLCVVLGGSSKYNSNAQLNAIFWNGNSNIAMDPTYFPMDQYQLIGDASDPITGFGEQQSFLVVFQERSVGRCKADYTELNGRTVVDMPYIRINDKIGCDCPGTIQLIENNLVWCNSEQGVHFLKDSSYAYENNIVCISKKINGPHVPEGLLPSTKDKWLTSHDDTRRYWLISAQDGKAWVWDYEHTSYKDPSWYPFDNVFAAGMCSEDNEIWGLHRDGGLFHFVRNYMDFGNSIEMSYRFATQALGGYDRLKNVNSVIICTRPDTNSIADLTYITDYEVRKDKTLLMRLVWSLVPRDLHFRSLLPANSIGAWVFRRRPMCRRVKHFTMQLDNTQILDDYAIGKDLSIVSAQIFFNYQGRFR